LARAAIYNGGGYGNDYAFAIAVDNSGSVYVSGYSLGSGSNSNDYATIKYCDNLPPVDVIAIDAPVSDCGLTASESVTVRVRNSGITPQNNVPVFYRINGGPVVNDTITATINPGDTVSFTFASTADLSLFTTYIFDAWTYLPGDSAYCRDTTSSQVDNPGIPVSFSGLSAQYCLSDAPAALTGSPSGGVFSGPGITDSIFDPAAGGVGTYDITYEYTKNTGILGYTLDTSGVFSPVAGAGTPVTLSNNQVSAVLPIGFNFWFYGNAYTDFYISSNGFIGFSPGMSNGCCTGSSCQMAPIRII